MQTSARVVLAADQLTLSQCLELVSTFRGKIFAIKIHQLWDQEGPGVVQKLLNEGAQGVWVDLKLDDIPETVGNRAAAVKDAGADILTVMAGAEVDAMMAAVKKGPPMILAVTQLTSLSSAQVEARLGRSVQAAVLYDARLAKLAGVHGVVCSPQETAMLRARPELDSLKIVNPGIRSTGQATHDQQRIGTPTQAILDGADGLVLGRQLLNAPNKMEALQVLNAEIEEALNGRKKTNA